MESLEEEIKIEEDGNKNGSEVFREGDDMEFEKDEEKAVEPVKTVAKGFVKQHSLREEEEQSSYDNELDGVEIEDKEEQLDKDEEEEERVDTIVEKELIQKGKGQRKLEKSEHYFDFYNEEMQESGLFKMEEGIPMEDLEIMHNYYATRKNKQKKRLKRMAKHMRIQNLFYTSKCFMLFHLVQNIIYWLIVIIFPLISVQGCVNGHHFMSHVAIALCLALVLIFDLVFAAQYISRESTK